MMVGILLPNDIAGDNVSPHVVGTKGPVIHLAHLIDVFDSYYLPKESNIEITSKQN